MHAHITTKHPTLSEVALALRVNGGVFEHMTRADALAAARENGVPLKDGRVMKGSIGVAEIAFAHQRRMDPKRVLVKVGQVWASNDHRDRKLGLRQHRTVRSIQPATGHRDPHGRRHAMLETEGSRFKGCFGVRILTRPDGGEYIDRHRLVHP